MRSAPRIDQNQTERRCHFLHQLQHQLPFHFADTCFSRGTDHERQGLCGSSPNLSAAASREPHSPVPRLISFLLTMKAPIQEGPTHTASVLGLGKGFRRALEKELGMDEVKVLDHKES